LAEQPNRGSVSLTPWRALAVAALFGGLAGWLVVVTANAFDMLPPRIPWSAPIGLVVFAALVGALAWSTHQRLQVRRERMEPQRAVAFLVLGKASALAGAAVAGGYLGFALLFLTRLDAATPRDRVIRSAVAVVAGVAVAIAGLRLERACKVPGADDDDELTPDLR
jgi:H+/Cl- antiporter ClcA